ncbi:family 16 glycoside hydrolase [Prosthecobacter sp.]|uniref:family 16 glycoside hydrolase n=1 Tax=Prosthecobacter sp. TaxID=1965333 RepID=UPI003784087F
MSSTLKLFRGRAAWLCLFFVLTHCGPAPRMEWKLLSPEFASDWKASGIPEEGRVVVRDGEITLQPGQPMTGARFDAWKSAGLPLTRYAIEYEAMRVAGNDFFGTVTFPVNDTHVSLVVGGWGGTLVGISSIDDMDASDNSTAGNAYFENNRWHKVRIEVRDDELRAWINDKLFVNTSTKGRKLGLRPGDIEKCIPFGFASYATQSRIRHVLVRRL